MPRQDVPYGGAICRLKERIAEIWDKLGEKLHSINGVEGDAAGDVKIVSGDAAVVVTSDQVNHEIEIALDSSQLPAAAVSSVNGQTGVVVLDGDDIELINGAGVTAANAIITNGQRLATLQGDLNTEISDRQTADAALQGNINTVQASIPGAAATAVANDPTVAQLVTDLAGKVDLSDVSTVETPNTIAKRNGSGRLVAADPASGATDKSLTTANWISQSGSGKPNNLIHNGGDEVFTGLKRSEYPLLADAFGVEIGRTFGYYKTHNLGAASTSGSWTIVIEYAYRYGFKLALVQMSFNASGVSSVTLTNYLGTAVGNTKVCFDIIDGNVYLVIHRVGQSNVFSRVKVLFVQKGTASASIPLRLKSGELYTPGVALIEEDLV